MKKNSIIWKIIGIVFVACLIVWFWPVAFHKPFIDSDKNIVNDTLMEDGVQTAPGDHTEYEYPDTPPVTETPYDPSNPDPIAPDHSADEPIAPDEPVACTMEAKMCPDGTYVGRQGPHCEFSPCPGN